MTGRFEGKVAFITGAARGKGVITHCGWRRRARTSSLSTPSRTTTPCRTPWPRRTTFRKQSVSSKKQAARSSSRTPTCATSTRSSWPSKPGSIASATSTSSSQTRASSPSGTRHELDEEKWGEMIDVNLSGVWRTVKAAIPHMIEQGTGGAIVLTASVAGLRAYTGVGHYVSAKHGVVGLMKTLAQELAPHRIRVNTVNPTQVDTEMVQNQAMYNQFVPGTDNPGRDDFAKASGDMILYPIPWVENDDVTNAVKFLASDEARYITGVALPVDGGVLVM